MLPLLCNFQSKSIHVQQLSNKSYPCIHRFLVYTMAKPFQKPFLDSLCIFLNLWSFDYPKLIVDTMSEKLSNFNTLTSFKYQAYLMYLILDKYSMHFQSLLEPEQLTPYDVISIIHRDSFLRDPTQGFSKFVNEFASHVYYFIYEANYPRVTQ